MLNLYHINLLRMLEVENAPLLSQLWAVIVFIFAIITCGAVIYLAALIQGVA